MSETDENKKRMREIERVSFEAQEAYYDGDFGSAEQILLRAVPQAEEFRATDPYLFCSLKNLLAAIYRETGREPEALALSLEILPDMETLGESDDLNLAGLLNNIGQMTRNAGNHAEALPYFERALTLKRGVLEKSRAGEGSDEEDEGPDPFEEEEEERAANSLALTYLNVIETHEALGDEQKAVAAMDEAYPHISEKANTEMMLLFSDQLMVHGREDRAKAMLESARDRLREELESPRNPMAMFNPDAMRFELYKDDFQKTGAVPAELYRIQLQLARLARRVDPSVQLPGPPPRLSSVDERAAGGDSFESARTLYEVAVGLHFVAKDYQEVEYFKQAEEYYRKALPILRNYLSPEHPKMREGISNLRELYEDTGRDPAEVDI